MRTLGHRLAVLLALATVTIAATVAPAGASATDTVNKTVADAPAYAREVLGATFHAPPSRRLNGGYNQVNKCTSDNKPRGSEHSCKDQKKWGQCGEP